MLYPVTTNQGEIPSTFKHIPTFSKHSKIEDALKKLYITADGVAALSRIMWVVSNYNNSIIFSPQILSIASLLLVYITEEETYAAISQMIKYSLNAGSIIKKYFTLNQTEMGKLTGMIVKVITRKRAALVEYLSSKRIDLQNTIVDLIRSFFLGYLPFTLLSRILPIFLMEGNKAVIKLVVSIFVNYSEKIMKFSTEDLGKYLKEQLLQVVYADQLVNYAFKIRLTKYSFDDVEAKYYEEQPVLYYRPSIYEKFTILNDHHIEMLWSRLPPLYKTYHPISVYSSSADGSSLRTLLRKTQDLNARTPMFFVLLTEFRDIVGVFVDCALHVNKTYIGDSSCFVFSLEPEIETFMSTGANSMYAMIGNELCFFGGDGNGPAISLDQELLVGQSYSCATYNNKVLGRNYFNVLSCEVIGLIM